jgi:hypothetical protein
MLYSLVACHCVQDSQLSTSTHCDQILHSSFPLTIYLLFAISLHHQGALGMERLSPKRLSAEGLWAGLVYWRPRKIC